MPEMLLKVALSTITLIVKLNCLFLHVCCLYLNHFEIKHNTFINISWLKANDYMYYESNESKYFL